MRLHRQTVIKLAALFVAITAFAPKESNCQTLLIDSTTADWIEGFVDFVKWEEELEDNVITIGILDAPEVATYLERRSHSRTNAPLISIKRLETHESITDDVEVLFVGSGNRAHWQTLIAACKSKGILTIGNQNGFIESGGCIEFSVQKNRIVFYANHTSLEDSEIEIRSQLLELAQND